MITFHKILFITLSYIIGSIPFGLLLGKIKNVDLRKTGSNNIGASNATRVLGKKIGILTYLLDLLKGALFVFLFRFEILPEKFMVLSPLLYGVIATLGHSYSIFIGFKGGKGVSTGFGAVFAYLPIIIIAIPIFLLVVKKTKIASIGSLVCTSCVVIISLIFTILKYDFITNLQTDIYLIFGTLIIAILIFIKHIPNIKRLINKTENTLIK